MTYKKITGFLLFLFFIGFSQVKANERGLDSVYYIKMNPFLTKLIELKDLSASISLNEVIKIIPTEGTLFAPNGQILIKDYNNIYINIEQTGFVFKLVGQLDSNAIFRRIDNTININYNIDASLFTNHGQLYSYGGYGFWKSNGHIRKFSYIDKEWDIIPTDKELFSSGFNWFSKKEGRLYLPFQKKLNAGIIGGGDLPVSEKFQSYYLDLDTKKWNKLGGLSSETKVLLENDNTPASALLSMDEGVLHIIHDEIYYFDFIHNKIYKSKKSDFNQFMIRRVSMPNMFFYKGIIYSYSSHNIAFNQIPFSLNDFELLNFPIWARDTSNDMYIVGGLTLVLIIIITIWFFNRSVKRKIEQSQIKLLKNKSVNQAFVGTEISLINLLLEAAENGKKVEIFQINHVLGIKDKNIGLQKKVRSDIINAINDKYQFITQQSTPLIGSVRKEDDKRFFEYFITGTELKAITRILEKN